MGSNVYQNGMHAIITEEIFLIELMAFRDDVAVMFFFILASLDNTWYAYRSLISKTAASLNSSNKKKNDSKLRETVEEVILI